MPRPNWSAKRERQYEHIKEGLLERGETDDTAEEIAARTVNKERARHGEAREHSRTSTDDISSGRRGGLRSHSGAGGRTYQQLYAEAAKKNVKGRSTMNKAQLERAVGRCGRRRCKETWTISVGEGIGPFLPPSRPRQSGRSR